jgi:3'(2'), 5'-bisphosphate nucleotidase
MDDATLAAHLAEMAGKLVLDARASGMFVDKALAEADDAIANQFLVHAIRSQRPDDGQYEWDSAEPVLPHHVS